MAGCESRTSLFEDTSFKEKLFKQLDQLMPSEGVLSLDVFDTLALRDDSSELTRFFEIGRLISEEVNKRFSRSGKDRVSAIDAFMARNLGTKASYRAAPRVNYCREGSLLDIHRVCSAILCGTAGYSEEFAQIEILYEAGRLAPNKLLLEYIRNHKRKGGRVVLVSDMYMHADQIRFLLSRIGIKDEFYDALFSSADTKVSKASGGIFGLVEDHLNAPAKSFLHVGDSFKGDFRQPRANGWRALHLPIPHKEILQRRRDHLKTAQMIQKNHGLSVDVAMPV